MKSHRVAALAFFLACLISTGAVNAAPQSTWQVVAEPATEALATMSRK